MKGHRMCTEMDCNISIPEMFKGPRSWFCNVHLKCCLLLLHEVDVSPLACFTPVWKDTVANALLLTSSTKYLSFRSGTEES